MVITYNLLVFSFLVFSFFLALRKFGNKNSQIRYLQRSMVARIHVSAKIIIINFNNDLCVFICIFIYLFIHMYIYLSVRNALPMIPLSKVNVSYIPRLIFIVPH